MQQRCERLQPQAGVHLQGNPVQLGIGAQLPLFNPGPNMEARSPINEPLLTGIKVCDAMKRFSDCNRWDMKLRTA